MRFREMEQIIDQNIDSIDYKATALASGNKSIENFSGMIRAINNIQALGFIDKEISELQKINTPFNSIRQNDSMTIDDATFTKFSQIIKTILSKCFAVRAAISVALPDQSPLSMIVGLPTFKNYTDLVIFYKSLDKVFNLFFEEERDNISIQNFDSGSLWTEVLFGTSAMVASFGSLVKLTSFIFLKIREHKIAEMQLKQLDYDESIKNALKEKLLEKALQDIETDVIQFLPEDQKGDRERVVNTSKALHLLYELLDQGTTFEAAIESNETIKESFPTLDLLKSLPASAKLKIDGDIPKLLTDDTANEDDHES